MAKLNITQVRSRIGSTKLQKKNLDALGLRKMNRTVTHDDSPVILGMIERVQHLVIVEPATDAKPSKAAPKAQADTAAKAEEPKAKAPAKKAAEPKAEAKPAAKAKPAAEEAQETEVKPEISKEDESE